MTSVPIAAKLVDAMSDAVVAGDPAGRITFWNAAAERMFGWPAATMLGRDFPAVPDMPTALERREAVERVLGGESVSLFTKRRRADGRLLDVWVAFTPLRATPDGPVTGWLSVIRDATRQRAIQRELRNRVELVSRLASVVAGVNSDLDLDTVLRRIAESGRELLAADAATYVVIEDGYLVIHAVSGLPARLIGERRPLEDSVVAGLLEHGRRSAAIDRRDLEHLPAAFVGHTRHLPRLAAALTHADAEPSGALFVYVSANHPPLGRAEHSVLELLADAAGTAIGNARAYQRLRLSREHERAVIDATADGMAVLDGDGLVRHWNPAAYMLTGLRDVDVVGKPLPFPASEPGVVVEHQLDNGRWLEILFSRIAASAETVVDFRDVTRAKEIEASKDLFLAVTSHELRTPITVIQGYASTLLRHWHDLADDERRDSVDRIAERTRALAALVEQLLLGSRAGSDVPRESVRFDLAGVLRAAIAGFSTLSLSHTFSLDIAPDLPDAVGDPSSAEIVLGQLLENAVKYSPDGGEITVTARSRGDRVIVEVADRGLGIPDGEHVNVFDRFYQVGGERRRFGGVGLGLYIVRKLLDSQGGAARAYPRPGGGTCFEISLPAEADVTP
jgi:PAS domain S-box-containing protein